MNTTHLEDRSLLAEARLVLANAAAHIDDSCYPCPLCRMACAELAEKIGERLKRREHKPGIRRRGV